MDSYIANLSRFGHRDMSTDVQSVFFPLHFIIFQIKPVFFQVFNLVPWLKLVLILNVYYKKKINEYHFMKSRMQGNSSTLCMSNNI